MGTNDDALANTLRMVANHGQRVRYYHDMVGCNSRLDTIQAAILEIKLRHLDEYIGARRRVADYYDAAFKDVAGVTTPYRSEKSRHVFHQYTLVLEGIDRNGLHDYLAEHNVPSMVYYPVPAHRQKMFAAFGSAAQNLPVTDWLTGRVISLPIHTEMEDAQLKHITKTILQFIIK